jgi:hypothetical protein
MIYPVNFPGVNRPPGLGASSLQHVARFVERGARFAPRAALALARGSRFAVRAARTAFVFSLIGGGGGGWARRGINTLLLALV